MDKARSVQEELVTTTNKMYETNTLIRKLNQDINKTDSLASKEKLRNFQQEIEGRQKDVQMTKASLDILKARYELLQAEMALEDAKNAKSTVRLQRDNEGNYGYVYTADQDDIDDAEQNLADKQNDLYNLVLNQTNDYHEKMVASRAEYLARVEEIMNDTTIDEQERARQLAELRKQFDQEWQIYEGNITEAVYYLNQEAVDGMSEAYTTMYDDRIVRLDEWMNICNEKEGDLQDLLDEVNSKRNEVKENTVTGLGEIKDRTTDIINENGSLSKQITGNIIPTMESEMIAVSNLTEAFSKKIDKIKETIDYYQNLIDVATQALNLMSMTDNSESSYDHSLRQGDYLVSGNLAGYAEENSLRSKAARNMSKENGYKWNQMELVTIQAIANEQGEDWNVIGNQVLNGKTDFTGKGADVLNLMGSQSSTRSKNNSDDQTALAQYLLDTGEEALAKNINLDQYNMSDEVRKELKNAVSGDTGMYTGEWGSSGKLAILHEKELLLNKDDTLNFLKALEVAKEGYQQAIQMQQLQSLYQQQIEASAASLATNFQNNNENVQQNVTIHAEFPNVTERNEIAEAFKTLVNEASQFANRY